MNHIDNSRHPQSRSSERPPAAESLILTDRDARTIANIVSGQCGIDLHDKPTDFIRGRLDKRLQQIGSASYSDYLNYLERTPAEFMNMVECLTTNMTYFFRDPAHYDFLQEYLAADYFANGNGAPLRIWSAGCSTGEEPYTIAIMLLSQFQNLDKHDVRILATDVSVRVLDAAREGVFNADALRKMPPQTRLRFFNPLSRGQYKISPEVAALVSFATLNLTGFWPMKGPFDVVFCRNVMMYFDEKTNANLVRRFFYLLRPGGVLITSHSEKLPGVRDLFDQVQPSVYRKPPE